jgi:hypothetical protein
MLGPKRSRWRDFLTGIAMIGSAMLGAVVLCRNEASTMTLNVRDDPAVCCNLSLLESVCQDR